jgi:hypothetical protein
MAIGDDASRQRQMLLVALRAAGIPLGELWIRYFGLGGMVGEYEVDAYLQGMIALPPLQRDLLAHAANELIDEKPPPPRAPYSDELQPGNTPGRPDPESGDVQRHLRSERFEDQP